MMLFVLVLACAAIFFIVLGIGIYNKLVTLRNRYQNAFAQIDVQLKRRYDLIPNLVETVRGYMKHERDTLEAVIAARNQAYTAVQRAGQTVGDASAMQGLSSADAMLTGALSKLIALSEAYPDLKANTNMAALQEELTSTENKVSFARQAYNDAVTGYNTARETFPNVLIAGPFNFQRAALFEIALVEQREAPRVSF